MNRRYFLMGTAAAAGALRSSSLASPNDTVRVACVGVRGQGRAHIRHYAEMPNVEIAALCDIDESVLNQRLADVEKLGKKRPAAFTDLRKLLEDRSIDAISIATPNHNHTLQTIWACQAGKDVYVEKPCSHNIFEARQIVAARQKYRRIVQHGTNSRSGIAREAVQKMREGLIGDIYMARGLCFKWRDTIGRKPVEPVPAGVHYDLWLGPAPDRGFTKNRFHYNWHWFWDTGNGDLGNQGIHEVDTARWGLGVKFPNRVSAIGGKFMFDDDQETPNTLSCAYQFDGADGKRRLLEFEVRHWISNNEAEIGKWGGESALPPAGLQADAKPAPGAKSLGPASGKPNTIGNLFYGPKGYLAIQEYTAYRSWLGEKQEPGPSGKGKETNFQNFFDCVRSRKAENLNASVEDGHISATLVHLGNVSYRLGRTLNFNPETEQVIGDDEANRMLREADRGYRKGFEIPDKV